MYAFRNKIKILGWGVAGTSPNTQSGEPPLFGCPQLLIPCTPNVLHICRPFFYPKHKEAPWHADRDSLIRVSYYTFISEFEYKTYIYVYQTLLRSHLWRIVKNNYETHTVSSRTYKEYHALINTLWLTSFFQSLILQLVKKFTTFYGTRKFITAFTTSRHLS